METSESEGSKLAVLVAAQTSSLLKFGKSARFRQFVTLTLLAVLGAGCTPTTITGLDVIEVGQFTSDPEEWETLRESNSGKRIKVKNYKLIKETNRIPAQIGNEFGVVFKIIGSQTDRTIELSYVTSHPTLTNPHNDRTYTQSEYRTREWIGGTVYRAYIFHEDWEIVPGIWNIAVKYKGDILLEKDFLIYEP